MLSSPSSKNPNNSSKKKSNNNKPKDTKAGASSKPNAPTTKATPAAKKPTPAAKKPAPPAKKPGQSKSNGTPATKKTNQAANRPNVQGNKTNSTAAPKPKLKSPSYFSSFDLEKLCFMLTFNKIEITAEHREALTLKVIDECYRPVEKPYISSKIYFTHDEIIELINFLAAEPLSSSRIEALKNIAFQLTGAFKSVSLDDVEELDKLMGILAISNPVQVVQKGIGEASPIMLSQDQAEQMVSLFRPINTTQNSFNSKQLLELLEVFSQIEPRNMTFVGIVTEILWVLLNKHKLSEFSQTEIFNVTNYAMMAARPITGNLRVCLFHLTNYILDKYKPLDLNQDNIPLLLKGINFMDACRASMPSKLFSFNCNKRYKDALIKRAQLLLEKNEPKSSPPHIKFSKVLATRLAGRKVKLINEYFSEITGTHLDMAIPERKIVIEIHGPKHYNKDGKTVNTDTRYKRELLEAFDWFVVEIPTFDIIVGTDYDNPYSEACLLDMTKVNQIISEQILPLLVEKPEVKESTLLRDTDPRFFMLPKQIYGHHPEMPLACDFEQKYERVTDKEEAAKRMHELEEESNRELITKATCYVEDSSVLTLDLTKTPHKRRDEALEAFCSFSSTAGRLAVNQDGELDIAKLPKVGGGPILISYARLRDAQATLVKSRNEGDVDVSDGPHVRVRGTMCIPILKKQ